MLVVVPNSLHEAIHRKIDEAVAVQPDAEPGREEFYSQLLTFFADNGYLPEFHLSRKEGS